VNNEVAKGDNTAMALDKSTQAGYEALTIVVLLGLCCSTIIGFSWVIFAISSIAFFLEYFKLNFLLKRPQDNQRYLDFWVLGNYIFLAGSIAYLSRRAEELGRTNPEIQSIVYVIGGIYLATSLLLTVCSIKNPEYFYKSK
jgi:hypothetical protein